MKRTKLNYRFHNPNSAEDTADFLCKLLIEANAGKVERAMEEAVSQWAEDSEYIAESEETEKVEEIGVGSPTKAASRGEEEMREGPRAA